MKRKALIIIVLATALMAAGIAQAEVLSYSPGFHSAQAEAGAKVKVPISVSVRGLSKEAGISFASDVQHGNIPKSWVAATPAKAGVRPEAPTAQAEISVSIPADAKAGRYSGFVVAEVTGLEGGADPGRGIFLSLVVTERAACSEAPDISVDSISPESIHNPNGKPVDVSIAGAAQNPEGCRSLNLSYEVADEYGEANTSGVLSAGSGGSFDLAVPVVASRKGKDKDGRLYKITLLAQNEAGVSRRTVDVTVLHDRR